LSKQQFIEFYQTWYRHFQYTHIVTMIFMNGTNFINGICKALHISITLICIWYMDTNYLKLQVVCNCSKVAAY